MIQPIITAVGVPVRGATAQVIGSGFGQVVSAFLVDAATQDEYPCAYQVDTGSSIHITVPFEIPDGTYFVRFGALNNIVSQNLAGTLVIPSAVVIPPLPVPDNPIPNPASPAMAAIRARTRLELGDYEEGFQSIVQGDGISMRLELPEQTIEADGLVVYTQVRDDPQNQTVSLGPGDYTLDADAGYITLTQPLPATQSLIVIGKHYQFFQDSELDMFITSAALEHVHGADTQNIFIDINHYKHYSYAAQTVDSINPVEYRALAMWSAVHALEVILADSSFNITVNSASGTTLSMEDRTAAIMALIAHKTEKYDELCQQLGIGLKRIEVFTLRRISRTTGRYVPIYVEREYDDVIGPPTRIYPARSAGVTGSGTEAIDPYAYGGSGYGGYPGGP